MVFTRDQRKDAQEGTKKAIPELGDEYLLVRTDA